MLTQKAAFAIPRLSAEASPRAIASISILATMIPGMLESGPQQNMPRIPRTNAITARFDFCGGVPTGGTAYWGCGSGPLLMGGGIAGGGVGAGAIASGFAGVLSREPHVLQNWAPAVF